MSNLDALNSDFRDIVAAFAEEGVEFMIVGGYAVSFHGYARTTGDIDLWVHPTTTNAQRVWRALLRFGAPVAALGIRAADFVTADTVVQFGMPPRRIDLLTGITGVTFDEAWAARSNVTWRGRSVAFIGIEELLRNKRATGRTKDLLDAEELTRHPRDPRG